MSRTHQVILLLLSVPTSPLAAATFSETVSIAPPATTLAVPALAVSGQAQFQDNCMESLIRGVIGNIDIDHEQQRLQGDHTAVNGLTIGVAVPQYLAAPPSCEPPSAQTYQSNGIGVYMTSASAGGTNGTNVVGGYYSVRALTSDANLFGLNPVLTDDNRLTLTSTAPALTGVTLQNEFDFDVRHGPSTSGGAPMPGTTVAGVRLVLTGTVSPAIGNGFVVDSTLRVQESPDPTDRQVWGGGFLALPETVFVGLSLAEQGYPGVHPKWPRQSAPIWLTSRESESLTHTAELFSDPHGALIVRSHGLQLVEQGSVPQGPPLPGPSPSPALRLTSIDADSTEHTSELFNDSDGSVVFDSAGMVIVRTGRVGAETAVQGVDQANILSNQLLLNGDRAVFYPNTGPNGLPALFIDRGGKIGIGNSNPNAELTVSGDAGIAGDIFSSGSVTAESFITVSDERLKTDIAPIDQALFRIARLQGVEYTMGGRSRPRRQMGLLAQNVRAVFPEAVHVDSNGYMGVAYQQLMGPLVQAVRELDEANKALRMENVHLQARLDRLETAVSALVSD